MTDRRETVPADGAREITHRFTNCCHTEDNGVVVHGFTCDRLTAAIQSYADARVAVADERFIELKRAQKIIDRLGAWQESLLCMQHSSTPEMRARTRELATPPRDDFDRAVIAVLDDFDAIETAIRARGEEL